MLAAPHCKLADRTEQTALRRTIIVTRTWSFNAGCCKAFLKSDSREDRSPSLPVRLEINLVNQNVFSLTFLVRIRIIPSPGFFSYL